MPSFRGGVGEVGCWFGDFVWRHVSRLDLDFSYGLVHVSFLFKKSGLEFHPHDADGVALVSRGEQIVGAGYTHSLDALAFLLRRRGAEERGARGLFALDAKNVSKSALEIRHRGR